MESKQTVRRYGVLVKLNEAERNGLAILREREALPGAQEYCAAYWSGKFGRSNAQASREWRHKKPLTGTANPGSGKHHGANDNDKIT